MTKKWMISILVFIVSVIFFSEPVQAANNNGEDKYIHIVFDNSISMALNENLSKETYALQVLLGMLGENDKAFIYPISAFDSEWFNEDGWAATEITLENRQNGSSLQNIIANQITIPMAEHTYFTAVETALKDLKAVETDSEKWLVVLSDGEYEDEKFGTDEKSKKVTSKHVNVVHSLFSEKEYKDINIIHYSFDQDIFYNDTIDHARSNITYYPESNTNDIDDSKDVMLSTMIEIGNQVFGRREARVADDGELVLDVPVKSLFLFAQDMTSVEDVDDKAINISASFDKISEWKGIDVKTITKMELTRLDANRENPNYIVNNVYSGIIRTYENFTLEKNGLLPADKYKIEGDSVKTLQVYYEPVIEIGFVFENKETDERYIYLQSDKDNKLPNGTYEVYIELFDPLKLETNNKESAIVPKSADIRAEVKTEIQMNDTNPMDDKWNGGLENGIYTFSGKADIYTGLSKEIKIEVQTVDFLRDIKVDMVVPQNGINIENLGAEENYIELKITNKGEILSEEYKDAIVIKHVNENQSPYEYHKEETEEGWKLWPVKKLQRETANVELSGIKKEIFQVELDLEDRAMIPQILEKEIEYHGADFSISIKNNWGENIGILEYFKKLKIEPEINGKTVDWKTVDVKNITYDVKDLGIFNLQVAKDGKSWQVVKSLAWWEILNSDKYWLQEQKVYIDIALERYGVEEQYSTEVKINMNIESHSVIMLTLFVGIIFYLVAIFIYKKIRKISIGKIEGNIEYCKDPLNYVDIRIRKCLLYNLFIPEYVKFKVYLNEINNGGGKKIIFKCSPNNICSINNFRKCQTFSQMRINGMLAKENSVYDLDSQLRIVLEVDAEKTIFINKKK